MKILVAIITVVFSLQAVLMSGAMAAGHMVDVEDSAVSLVKQDATQAKAINFSAAEIKLHPQDSGSNTSQEVSCSKVECVCTALLVQPRLLNQAQQSGIKNTFYLVHLAEPPSFALPHPPRTTQI